MAANLNFFKPISFHNRNLEVADIEDLIQQGADINERDRYGETPLLRAARQINEELAIGLIAHGANVNAKGPDNRMALHWAAIHREKNLVQSLIQNGAEVDAKDDQGRTALHYAALCDEIGSVQSLVVKGADVKATDNEGKTPLHVALDWKGKRNWERELALTLERHCFLMREVPSEENCREIAVVLIGKGADLYAWPIPVNAHIERKIKEVETALVSRRIRALEDMFVFYKTLEPKNFLQWLPREIVEDVVLLDPKVKELQDGGFLRLHFTR